MAIHSMLRWVLLTLVAVAKTEHCENAGDDLQLLQERRNRKNRQPAENTASLSEKDFEEVEVNVFFPLKEVPQGLVGKDMGNATRRHFFVIGPEGSSMRFWSMQVAAGMNLTNSDNMTYMVGGGNNLINNLATLSHISLPFGNTCWERFKNKDLTEKILLDYGGRPESYQYTGQETVKMGTVLGLGMPIFFVDPLEVIKAHHMRNDDITVIMTIRDPRASMENKVQEHCKVRSTGRKEQKKAFELLLKAARAAKESEEYKDSVNIACYEECVSKGAPYIKEKLRSMGITPSEKDPEFFNGNDKYHLEGHDCESDSLAYAELCPDTDFGREVKAGCTDAATPF